MFNSIAYAEGAAPAAQGAGFSMLIPMVLVFGIFYFVVMRPQQKKQKELQNALKLLKSGDRVILNSGIFGVIDSAGENNSYYVTIASGVKIHVTQAAIAGKISDTPTAESKKK